MMRLKKAFASLVVAGALALVSAPTTPLAKLVPTVGGVAHAYAPCQYLGWRMTVAVAVWMNYPSDINHSMMIAAINEYFDHCGA